MLNQEQSKGCISTESSDNTRHIQILSMLHATNVDSAQYDAMDCEANSHGEASDTEKGITPDRGAYMPVNYICDEAYALLTAYTTSSVPHAHESDASGMEIDVNAQDLTVQSALGELYDPVRCLSTIDPPKKFFRTFWKSVSNQLLRRWAQTALPSSQPERASIRTAECRKDIGK